MSERFVAKGGWSRYPEGRRGFMAGFGEGSKDELSRDEARARVQEELRRDHEYVARLANPESVGMDKVRALEKLVEGGIQNDTSLPEGLRALHGNLEHFARTGRLPEQAQAPKPLQGFEGPSQKFRPGVLEDQSGATIVADTELFQYLPWDVLRRKLRERGLGDVQLPEEETWNGMDVVHRNRWLMDKQEIFASRKFGDGIESELVLPKIEGGAGIFDWENVLEEKYQEIVEDPRTGEEKIVDKVRPVSLRTAIARLVELFDQKGLTHHNADALKQIDEYLDKLSVHFQSTYLDRAQAVALGKIKDYAALNEMVHTLDDLSRRFALSGKSAAFNNVFGADVIKRLNDGKIALDDDYRKKYKENPQRYEELFRRLEEEAAQVIQIQKYGLYGKGDTYRKRFDAVADSEIKAAVNEDDREMLRWRKQVLRAGFDLNYNEIRIKQPTADWRDSGKNLDLILRFLERTDFSEQQLSQALQSAAQIVQDIPINSPALSRADKEEAEKLQKDLTDKLQAILAVDSFYSVMEHADMNPEKVMGAFGNFKDNTFEIFFERFAHDSLGNKFKSKEKDDATGKEKELDINLLNVGMGVYMRRLHTERRIMNYVEKWTRNIDVRPGKAEEGVEAECLAAIADIEKRTGKDRKVPKIIKAVTEWYRENTILGAHDEATKDKRKAEMAGNMKVFEPDSMTAKDKEDEAARKWKVGLIEELRDKFKIDDGQLKMMIDDGMIEQVMNNAHRLSWMMAWSDYDGIRIWDPKAENPAFPGTGRVVEFVFNGSTHMFHGRMVDHAWEFFINEKRGRVPKSNLIMQDELLGDRGNLLPQNRTMVRFARDMMGAEAFKAYIDSRIGSFKNIDKFDWRNSEEERGWAESAIISEGIDSGELNFDSANFVDMFKTTGSWKYRWIDLYGDRKAMMDYMGPTALQQYLQQPNTEKFFQINSLENFYSKREVRLQPWMKLAIGAHQRIGNHWKEWWGEPYRMQHAEKEAIIEFAARTNRLDAKYKDWMKRRYMGWGGMPGVMPVRNARMWAEVGDILSREFPLEVGKNLWRAPVAWTGATNQVIKYIIS